VRASRSAAARVVAPRLRVADAVRYIVCLKGSESVKRTWIRTSPLAEVTAVGQRNCGKKQLRIDEARKLVEEAGVPVVCSHSLRGLHATLATAAGATSHVVASALGHSSPAVTHAHYIEGRRHAGARGPVRTHEPKGVGPFCKGPRSIGANGGTRTLMAQAEIFNHLAFLQ
jgi:integrase